MADYPITAVTRRKVYSGSAGVGPYAFTFPILVQTDIVVYKNSTLLTLTTDYTVTINGTNGTGSVTLVSPATGSDTITIIGARAIQRTTDFVTAGDLAASSLNEQLDANIIMTQQLAEENKRTLKAPPYDPEATVDGGTLNMTLPAKADRAGKVLAFDADGNPSAGAVSLPTSLTATYYPRVNTGGTAYELRAPASVRSDIGADNASNLTSGTVSDSRLPATIDGKTLTNVTITSGSITGITDLAIADGGTGASSASAARNNLGLAIGTDVQAYDPQLADIAGLTPTDSNFIVGNGTNFVTESGATARTSLGLGSIATQDANNVSITGGSISGVTFTYATPVTIPGTSSATGEIRLAEDTDNGTNYVGFKAPASISADLSWTLPAADGGSGQFLSTNGSGVLSWSSPAGGGDVVGPASSTDNAVARFDLTSGKLLQNSAATLSDSGVLQTAEVSTDTISEKTAAAGVTVDGVLLKDSAVSTDTINEKTAAAGVTIDSVLLKDGGATLTAPIILGAGTVSAPSVTTTGDTNTGIFFPAADTIAFTEGGVEAMRIDSSANVGIGTNSPSGRLNIAVGAATICEFRQTSNNTGSGAGDRCRWNAFSADNSGVAYQLGFMDFDRADGTGTSSYWAVQTRVSGTVAERMRISASGDLQFNSGYGSVATAYGCRAWVNFNGTGTVAIRASGNVTSITDVGVGTYTVNFTSALVDANYSVSFASAHNFNSTNGDQGWANLRANNGGTNPQQTTSLAIWASSKASSLGAAVDNEIVDVAVFR